jgi:hypothetical protein
MVAQVHGPVFLAMRPRRQLQHLVVFSSTSTWLGLVVEADTIRLLPSRG